MKRFRIEYYVEVNDECVERSIVVEKNTILEALQWFFNENPRVFKSVVSITEIAKNIDLKAVLEKTTKPNY